MSLFYGSMCIDRVDRNNKSRRFASAQQ